MVPSKFTTTSRHSRRLAPVTQARGPLGRPSDDALKVDYSQTRGTSDQRSSAAMETVTHSAAMGHKTPHYLHLS
jgi:hypothetical protein